MILEFVKENLFNVNGRFEGQRLVRRWFEIRNLEKEFDKYSYVLLDEEKLFTLLRDNDLLQTNYKKSQKFSKCLVCDNKTEFLGRTKGYKNFCSKKCENIMRSTTKNNKTIEEKAIIVGKIKKTKLEKYGDENYNNREKSEETCLIKYGFKHVLQCEEIIKKSKKTKFEKYGDENYNNREKSEETCLIKYGYKNVLQVPEIIERVNKTKLEKYGSIHVTQNKLIKEKTIKTNLEKYGVPWSFQSNNNKNKSKITWFKKYGCHVTSSPYIKEKIKNKKEQKDEFNLNSWDRARIKNEESGRWIELSELNDFTLYSRIVDRITNKQNLISLKNFDKRGRVDMNPEAYHLDHKFSIYEGFKQNIPPYIIGDICNLEMLDAYHNSCIKNKKCSITEDELIESFYMRISKSA